MAGITKEDLENWFTYHAPPDEATKAKYIKLRDGAHEFAKLILECCPPCADQSAAIRKVREAVMTCNAAIACEKSGGE
jgi:hypothetical protein